MIEYFKSLMESQHIATHNNLITLHFESDFVLFLMF